MGKELHLASNVTLWVTVVIVKDTGKKFVVFMTGNREFVDRDAVIAAERSAWQSRFGKLDPSLHARIKDRRPNDPVQVYVWLRGLDPDAVADSVAKKHSDVPLAGIRPKGPIPPQVYEAIQREYTAALDQASLAIQRPLIEFLTAKGISSVRIGGPPIVVATVPKSLLVQIEARPEAMGIMSAEEKAFPALGDSIGKTQAAPFVWDRGIDGAIPGAPNYKVGVIDTGLINFQNPYLKGTVIGLGSGFTDHSAAVAGVLASSHPVFRGMAPGVTNNSLILSADMNSPDGFVAVSQQVIDNGARAINYSISFPLEAGLRAEDRFLDWVVRHRATLPVVAAGNTANCPNGDVLPPGRGWNVLTVGAYDDLNTPAWGDDLMWSGSCWRNPSTPSSPGVEKPEVVAVGDRVRTLTHVSPWFDPPGARRSGTSMAAPSVTGLVALLLQRSPILLGFWPETLKAIVMASAIHNVEPGVPPLSSLIDYKDGAGGIYLPFADTIAANGTFLNEAINLTTSFDANGVYIPPRPLDFTASAGQTIRAALTWDSDLLSTGSTSYDIDQLVTDLDLELYEVVGGSEIFRQTSNSGLFNSFEVIHYQVPANNNPPVSTFRLKVKRFSSSETTNRMGLAWGVTPAIDGDATLFGDRTANQSAELPLEVKFFAPGADVLTAPHLSKYGFKTRLKPGTINVADFDITDNPSGVFDVTAKMPHSLINRVRNVSYQGPMLTLNMGQLRETDSDNTGFVNILDISLTNANFGRLSPIDVTPQPPPGGTPSTTYQDITGRVTFQGGSRPVPSGWEVPILVRFFSPGVNVLTSSPLFTYEVTTSFDASLGRATFFLPDVQNGTFDVTIHTSGTLRNVYRSFVIKNPPDNTLDMGTFISGDMNDDGFININDITATVADFGKSSPIDVN